VADTWTALHPGEVRYGDAPAQTILSAGGDPAVAAAFDPVSGGLACTTAPGAVEGPGVATYELPVVTGSGYTLLGAPTVTADLEVTGAFAYVAARLVDVDPQANTKTLIARGLYRIDPAAPNGRQTFQLHANGWHFAAGHIPRLELLGRDAPYARPSNGTFAITVSNLELRLPVRDAS
jgi:predicted acyl esterase